MNYTKLEYFISRPRLDKFRIATGNSVVKAEQLYHINLRVSRSFYPILHMFELALRNSINENLALYFSNPQWIIHEKDRFMSAPSLGASGYYLKRSVEDAESFVTGKYGSVSAGRIISCQHFGFWTRLFDLLHWRLINGNLIRCFPARPRDVNRRVVSSMLNRIRGFRNRVYHNEPICFSGSHLNFDMVHSIREEIYTILRWMDEDLAIYIQHFDDIDAEIARIQDL
ncbi:MAG: Abi family protein [Chitinophagaceae bacterium]|nr:Abi family protein [Chitinophagaceae bacterium]